MLRRRIIIIGILSLGLTFLSPFVFLSYFESQPKILNQQLTFGGPFPFAEQMATLPADEQLYPLEVKFESPFEKETNFKMLSFILSFIFFYLFLFALYSIFARFIRKPLKEPK